MKLAFMTQRTDSSNTYLEKRDVLDQRWIDFVLQCGLIPVIVPNNYLAASKLLKHFGDNNHIGGIILTGGGHLSRYGGDAPEREEVEHFLIEYAIITDTPLLGVCRGMQAIQHFFGQKLIEVDGHVSLQHHVIDNNGYCNYKNSYHHWGTKISVQTLVPTFKCIDGVIEAIEHLQYKIKGIMWHPERNYPFDPSDIDLFKRFLNPQWVERRSDEP
ncbi:gamma-glutamyl-gamma-aminobutyrate hydrolase family protein [Paenibacillus agilis]|uniref:Gamma-glutamyl-gamma-aminobutyrate hydrolase n=1 Tax=Paenibacillus agilis TaxID=3020863 RepID=A0A559J112_9BACL|nr:gamma-glutamyl-gamma-aminobutyrate hydrolase family protein [Paenibacillus agilis]TVX93574.1 gamma-glutamyl-gamma-aminobutyrate hydrolase [Paenibacillus agilis]